MPNRNPWRLPSRLSRLPLLLVLSMLLGLAALRPLSRGDAAACAARGALDTPAAVVAGGMTLDVGGWAHDPLGVREIRVAAGGRVLARGRPEVARPDVVAALGACAAPERSGFTLRVPLRGIAPGGARLDVSAVNHAGRVFPVGSVAVRFERPLAHIDTREAIRWDAANLIAGWALAPEGTVRVRVLAGGREVAAGDADLPRADLPRVFPAWPHAARAGFSLGVSLAALPRGRYPLRLRFEAANGRHTELAGPEVWNDEPLGKVVAAADRLADPAAVDLDAWAFSEDGIEAAVVETEAGIALGPMRVVRRDLALADFERVAAPAGPAAPLRGTAYRARVVTAGLPAGVHRLVVRATDRRQRSVALPGPLLRVGGRTAPACDGTPRRLYYPGNHKAFRGGFAQMQAWRALTAGGCVEVGIRGRVEYLRTTHGRRHDYRFDADFPDAGRLRNGREMTGVSLRMLLDLALAHKAPLLVTLDGGVWADNAFADPEIDVVDMLEADERTVQWNQFGRAEADRALADLPGALDSPELARMMSLNRYNQRFRDYKKRNLQAAVREILRFARAHPDIDVRINLDPDNYINPWFYMKQWYDYNPDALRQFREWLFHLGPYADGGELAHAREVPKATLESAGRLAGRAFASVDAVDPPREAIDYDDPWQQAWSRFRRHLVAQHYEDLADWAVEAGMAPARIHTAQTFIQADVAVGVRDRATGWTDQAGVSIEGAKPRRGHLGTIMYGPASRNLGATRAGRSLVDTIRSVDPAWGVVEFHPAVIALREQLPSHAEAYQTLLALVNGGAAFLSPMWNSRAADQRLHPERFRSYDALEGTAFEYQMAWWLLELQRVPLGTLLFPFGNSQVASADGWVGVGATTVIPRGGRLVLRGTEAGLASPEWEGMATRNRGALGVSGAWPGRQLRAEIVFGRGGRATCGPSAAPLRCDFPTPPGDALKRIRLAWSVASETAETSEVALDEVRVDLR